MTAAGYGRSGGGPAQAGSRRLAWGSLAVLALGLPLAAAGFPNEPDGFGGARFGMAEAEVRKVFPDMKLLASAPVDGLPMTFYALAGQSVLGLAPCAVEMRFAADQLYEITFDCGRDDKVIAALRERWGPPVEEPTGHFWFGERGGITLNPRAKTFAFVDMARNRRVQGALLANAIRQAAPADTPGK